MAEIDNLSNEDDMIAALVFISQLAREAGMGDLGATTTAATTSLTYSIPVKGWTASTTWVMPEYFIDDTGTTPSAGDMGVRFDDFNGDGLVDMPFAILNGDLS